MSRSPTKRDLSQRQLAASDHRRQRRAGRQRPRTVLLLAAAELAASDAYDVEDYVRSRVTLVSGTRAWAYLGTPRK
jgi:hypothetical protein